MKAFTCLSFATLSLDLPYTMALRDKHNTPDTSDINFWQCTSGKCLYTMIYCFLLYLGTLWLRNCLLFYSGALFSRPKKYNQKNCTNVQMTLHPSILIHRINGVYSIPVKSYYDSTQCHCFNKARHNSNTPNLITIPHCPFITHTLHHPFSFV